MVRILVVCVFVLVLHSIRGDEDDPGDVIVLDDSNFAEGVNVDIILVEFYAPWCGHCKRLAPEYAKAATMLKASDPPIPIAKVDCPANSALCSKYGVSGYPTMKIFRNGEFSADYNGPRTADGIVAYMKKQSGPSSRDLNTVAEMKTFIENDEHSVIGFFTSEKSELKVAFSTVSNTLRESFRFAHSDDKEVLDEYGFQKDTVAIFQPPRMVSKLETTPFVYDGPAKTDKLKHFIQTEFMGLAGVRNSDNMNFFEEKKPLCVVYYEIDYSMNPKGTNYWRNRVIKVAKGFTDKDVSFAISDRSDFSNEVEALGAQAKDPTAAIYDSKGKYAMEKDFSVDALREFVQDYLDGKLEPYIKSEPIPADNEGPVKVVVGKNFDQIVNDESKDVLIEFYAPWCGHCKALAPKYDELGEKLRNDPNIVIAKTDATANDYPPIYEVRGYPTIFWVPAGNKSNPQKYESGREVTDFMKFIKENATNPPVVEGEKSKKKAKKGKKEEL